MAHDTHRKENFDNKCKKTQLVLGFELETCRFVRFNRWLPELFESLKVVSESFIIVYGIKCEISYIPVRTPDLCVASEPFCPTHWLI